MEKHAILIENDARFVRIYLPHHGAVSFMVGLSDGQTVQLAMAGRDSMVGASAALGDQTSTTNAVMLFPGSASMIDAAAIWAAAERSSGLRRLLARQQQALHAQAQQATARKCYHVVKAKHEQLMRAQQ